MKFKTPAFVRVENPQERKELLEWLMGIGYKNNNSGYVYPLIFTDNRNVCYTAEYPNSFEKRNDCGTDIHLFKALAAMNDENDREQWFVSDITGDFSFCRNEYSTILRAHGDRKATAEEVISHFKNKRHV